MNIQHGETTWSVVLHRLNKDRHIEMPHVERKIYKLCGRPKYIVNRFREGTEFRKKLPFKTEFEGEERKYAEKPKKVGFK